MNREIGAWLAVALLSISALGVSATTLESTMSTDANDVVDLDYDRIPIGQDTASNVLDEIEGSERAGESATSQKSDAQPNSHSASSRPDDSSDSSSSQADESASADSKSSGQNRESTSQSQQRERSGDDGSSTTPEVPSLLDRLLALLTALLPSLLALGAALAAVGLAVRYRDRLFGLFEQPEPDDAGGPTPSGPESRIDGSPAHTVEEAWLGMVRYLDLDRPGTMTTSECARAAIEAGLDREAVRTLTETYEEVRYGNEPVTERREQAALQSQRRLDVGGGS